MSTQDERPGPHSDRVDAWQRVAELFDQLATESPDTREAVLSQSDISPEVRAWLDTLLAAHDRDQTAMIDRQMTELVQQLVPGSKIMQDADAFFERRFGPWQAGEEIGRGGMGLVLHGQRADGQFDKQVAIKLLDPAHVGSALKQQLRQELRLLARLSHPAIAQVLDGGVTDDGVPYLVMEYVDGVPITRFCDEQGLDLEQRLRLFYRVAEAVSYCHRQLVVHGDIKPDNVLVDADGQVKLLDFGIASRLTESRDENPDERANAQRWCSPAYAAPERLEGAPPSVAEDVYALGALLYELLSGGRIRSTSDITRVATHQSVPSEPIPVSAMAARRGQSSPRVQKLKGDLDQILAHALGDAPDQRYASVDALIADLRSWQQHAPISLRTSETGYRIGRWLRRNRTLAAAATLVTLALIIGLGAALWQADRAEQAATLAEQNAERATAAQATAERALARADQINRFLLDLFEAQFPNVPPDELPTTRQILDQGLARARDPAAGPPELRAGLLFTLIEILAARRQLDEVDELLNEIEQMVDLNNQSDLALKHAELKAQNERAKGDYQAAEVAYRHALELYRQYAPDHLRRLELRRELAWVLTIDDQWDEAETLLNETLAEAELRDDTENLLMGLYIDLGRAAGRHGDWASGNRRFEQLLELRRASGDYSTISLAGLRSNIAGGKIMLFQYDEARNDLNNLLADLKPFTETALPPRATALRKLGQVAHALGQFDVAENWYAKSASEWARARNREPGAPDNFYRSAFIAPLLADSGRFNEAVEESKMALEKMQVAGELSALQVAVFRTKYARYLCEVGDFEQAWETVANIKREDFEGNDSLTTALQRTEAVCKLKKGELAPDPKWLPESAIAHVRKFNGDASYIARFELLRAELLIQSGQPNDARTLIESARERLEHVGAIETHPLWQEISRLNAELTPSN